jgi:hypothetical protein
MIEPELKKYLDSIQKSTELIARKQPTLLKSFINGLLSGLGSLLGAAIGLIVIGYVLNILGVIPALREESQKWRDTIQSTASKQLPQGQAQQKSR